MKGRPWEAGDRDYHKGSRESQTRNLYLLVTLYYMVKGGTSVNSRSLQQASWPVKMDAKADITTNGVV